MDKAGKASMDIDENIVVFQNPDGTIQLGTQPHYKNKKIIQCWSCKNTMVCSLNFDFAKCFYCQKLNNLASLKSTKTPQDNTGRVVSCGNCGEKLRIANSASNVAVHCALCHHVTNV